MQTDMYCALCIEKTIWIYFVVGKIVRTYISYTSLDVSAISRDSNFLPSDLMPMALILPQINYFQILLRLIQSFSIHIE